MRDTDFATQYVTPNFFVDPFVSGGDRFVILNFDEKGSITAVLSGVSSDGVINSGLPSRPQAALRRGVDPDDVADALASALTGDVLPNVKLINLHSWTEIPQLRKHGFRHRTTGSEGEVVILDLSKGEDQLFKEFSQTRRNEIRKAEKLAALEIKQLETESELQDLYEVYCDWNRRKGNVAGAFELFVAAAEQDLYRTIFIAKVDEKVVAGSFFRFCQGGVVEYAANNSLTEYQRLKPNDLLCWNAIQWACKSGFRSFSMGGAHLFLRRFGGKIISTNTYTLDGTLFKTHHLKRDLTQVLSNAYQLLPNGIRAKLKTVRS